MKLGYLQVQPQFGKIKNNVENAIKKIENIKADLLVLPELFNTGYTFKSKEEAMSLAENIPNGYTTQKMIQISQTTGISFVFGLAEIENAKLYNSAVVVSPEGYVGKYRKAHLFFKEKLWFEKGDSEFPIFEINGVKIGVMVCFDWIFPEVARILALKGAQIICHCANLVMPYCQKAMFARCIENQVFAITCNRIGREKRGKDDFTFTGGSVIINPKGEYLSQAPTDKEIIDILEIDPEKAKNKNMNEFNNLFEDRRIQLYKKLLS